MTKKELVNKQVTDQKKTEQEAHASALANRVVRKTVFVGSE